MAIEFATRLAVMRFKNIAFHAPAFRAKQVFEFKDRGIARAGHCGIAPLMAMGAVRAGHWHVSCGH